MVDIGATVMAVNVLRNGQSIYMREQPFGGNQLTQDIQNRFGLSPEEAEAAKRAGGLPENYDTEVLQPFMDMLGLEIARALQFFFTSTQYNQVDQIVLSGGCAAHSRRRRGGQQAHPGQHGHRQSVRQHGGLVQDPAAEPDAGRAVADGRLRPGDAEVRSMIRINLLPHREMRRTPPADSSSSSRWASWWRSASRSWLVVHYVARRSSYEEQTSRNKYLRTRSPSSTSRSRRSRSCKEQTASLLARKKVVETLQATARRSCICSTSSCASCPTASTSKAIKQTGQQRDDQRLHPVEGARLDADAQPRGLALPREPRAGRDQGGTQPGNQRLNEFTLNINITRARPEEDAEEAGAKPAAEGGSAPWP